nr:hypothetical protein [Jatrophihabitans sp. GAS493]
MLDGHGLGVRDQALNLVIGWLVACCARCNGRKRDRTPEQAGMKLLVTPYAPRRRR